MKILNFEFINLLSEMQEYFSNSPIYMEIDFEIFGELENLIGKIDGSYNRPNYKYNYE